MSAHKARERREERLKEKAEDRAGMVAFMACILASRQSGNSPIDHGEARCYVVEARRILTESHTAEGLPSPFPAASTDTENSNNG